MSVLGRVAEMRSVQHAVDRFVEFVAEERVQLYRMHLQATVTSISPLAVDMAAHAGVGLDEVARLLPVPRRWPQRGLAINRGQLNGWSAARGVRSQPKVSLSTAMRLRGSGVAVRGEDDGLGDLGFVPERGVLEAVSRMGSVTLHTSFGKGLIFVRDRLPECVLTAAVGRRVDAVVSHPALDGRDYRIGEAFLDEFVDASVLVFRTGLVPLELPWASELSQLVSENRADLLAFRGHSFKSTASPYLAGSQDSPNRGDLDALPFAEECS